MSLIETLAFGWLVASAATLIFLTILTLQALRNGGIQSYRRLGIGIPALLMILLAASLAWPWAFITVLKLVRRNT